MPAKIRATVRQRAARTEHEVMGPLGQMINGADRVLILSWRVGFGAAASANPAAGDECCGCRSEIGFSPPAGDQVRPVARLPEIIFMCAAAGTFGNPGIGHDIAANRHDETRPCGKAQFVHLDPEASRRPRRSGSSESDMAVLGHANRQIAEPMFG